MILFEAGLGSLGKDLVTEVQRDLTPLFRYPIDELDQTNFYNVSFHLFHFHYLILLVYHHLKFGLTSDLERAP